MDNFFKQCPPMMSDGRLFTDYRTPVRRNEYVKYINDIVRDDEYRMFLQDNAETILDNEWKFTRSTKSCWVNECVHNYPTRSYPAWFNEEKQVYNTLFNPKRRVRYVCPPQNDYRMATTKGTKY